MTRKTILFLSHSSDDKNRAEKLCRSIEGAADAPTCVKTTFDVRDLRSGEAWKPQLYRWIARCDAGLVLLTANVLARPGWVLQEATLLRSRSILEPGFKLFLVVDADVRSAAGWEQFEALALPELQYTAGDAAAVAAQVLDQLGQSGDNDPAGDYFRRLCSVVSDRLQPFLRFDGLIKELHDKLDSRDEYWESVVGRDGALGHALASRLVEFDPCSTTIGGYSLGRLFEALQGYGQADERVSLFDAVKSYWVSLQAATAIVRALALPAGRRLCVLRTAQPKDSPSMYVDRLFIPYRRSPHLFRLGGGNESAQSLGDQLVESYNIHLQYAPDEAIDRASVADEMATSDAIFIVVLPVMAAPPIARALAAEFGSAVFVLPVTHQLSIDTPEWSGIERMEPVRDDKTEQRLHKEFRLARSQLLSTNR